MNIAKTKKGTQLITTIYTFKDENEAEQTDTIQSWVKRGAFSLKIQDELRSGDGARMSHALAKILDRWDIDLDGEPFPPTQENIYEMDDKLLAKISIDILSAISGNPTKVSP